MATKKISDLNIRITASSEGLRTGIRGATGELKQFETKVDGSGAALRRFATAAGAAFATLKLAQFGKQVLFDGVRLAAGAEQASVAFTTLLGSADAAKQVLGELQEFAASTPFRIDDIRDAAQMLAAFGTAGDEITPTLRAIGDLAAGTGNGIAELAEIYGKAQVQGTLFAQDINQLTARGIPIIQEFAKQLGVAESEVKKLGSEGKLTFANLQQAFIDLTSEGGKFAGLAAAQSQTIAGQWSTLQDNINALKRSIGEGLLPELTRAIGLMQEFLTMGENTPESMKSAAAEVANFVVTAIEKIMAIFRNAQALILDLEASAFRAAAAMAGFFGDSDAADSLRVSAAGIDRTADKYRESAGRLWHGVRETKKAAKEAAATLGSSLGDIAKPTEAVDEFAKGLEEARKKAESLAESLTSKYATPIEQFESAIGDLVTAFNIGGLGPELFARGVNAEIDKVLAKAKELNQTLNQDINAVEFGSAGDLAAEARRRNQAGNAAAESQMRTDMMALVSKIKNDASQLQQAPGGLQQSIAANQENVKATKDVAETLRKQHLARMPAMRSIVDAVERVATRPQLVVNEVGI